MQLTRGSCVTRIRVFIIATANITTMQMLGEELSRVSPDLLGMTLYGVCVFGAEAGKARARNDGALHCTRQAS